MTCDTDETYGMYRAIVLMMAAHGTEKSFICLSAAVAMLCAEAPPKKSLRVDRKKSLAFYDKEFRKAVISGFDLVDRLVTESQALESALATKQ